jgi:hypothetical protein
MTRALTAAAVLAASLVVATTTAAAPSSAVLIVSPTAVHRGHLLLIGGSAGGCPRGDTVTVLSRAFPHTHEFAGVPAVLTKVRSAGQFLTSTRIPQTRRPGRYRVTARCGGGNLGVSARLRVLP